MEWTDLLTKEIEYVYPVTEKIMDLLDDDQLDWKPATGSNWMTTGQLLMHISGACGAIFKGFVTGDWGLPPDMDLSKMSPEEMLPTADKMPTVKSVAEAKQLLATDKQVALQMLQQAGEEALESKPAPAPWDPSDMNLGYRLLSMVQHLAQHKAQLFYYLKLQGKPVDTHTLWGM